MSAGKGKTIERVAVVLAALLCLTPAWTRGAFAEGISILITSNLEGRTNLKDSDTPRMDPLDALGRCVIREKQRKNADIFIDMGNAFYPGVLSKYSFGSLMMDFFDAFGCAATVVSSRDLRIGVDNLSTLQSDRSTAILSSNIVRKGKALYSPVFYHQAKSAKIAFIGLSSRRIQFDIAEKNVYGTGIGEYSRSLAEAIGKAKEDGAGRIVLLTGADTADVVALMRSFGEINLAICGGDNRGALFGAAGSRLDFDDGRSIVFARDREGYSLLDIEIDAGISVRRVVSRPLERPAIKNDRHREFTQRLDLWRKKYQEEGGKTIAQAGDREHSIDDERVAALLMDRFNAEIALVDSGTINRTSLRGDITEYHLDNISNDEYPVFVFRMQGEDVMRLPSVKRGLLTAGLREGSVQGYPVDPARSYRIAATQSVFEMVSDALGVRPSFDNRWKSIPEVFMEDLKAEKIVLRDDHSYLERRFRATVDFMLSNYLDHMNVEAGEEMSAPAGKSSASYRQWGLENKIVLTLYNRYHQFILTPYMNYAELRQEETDSETGETYMKKFLTSNLLRGTLEYNLNISRYVNPYHKSQIETVVKRDEEDKRPTIIRETLGARFKIASDDNRVSFEGRLGAGFERQVHDPKDNPLYGFETILSFKWEFIKNVSYMLALDSFLSKTDKRYSTERGNMRTEIVNGLSVALNSYLGVSAKYKYFYYRSDEYDESYTSKQFITSLDLKTDFKMF